LWDIAGLVLETLENGGTTENILKVWGVTGKACRGLKTGK